MTRLTASYSTMPIRLPKGLYSQLRNTLRPFWKIHNDLYIVDNLLMYGNRLVIPASLRKEVLESLHAAHQGVVGMKARAATCVYWPGISADISNRWIQCRICNTIAPSQAKLPLHPPPAPVYPFEHVFCARKLSNDVGYLAVEEFLKFPVDI